MAAGSPDIMQGSFARMQRVRTLHESVVSKVIAGMKADPRLASVEPSSLDELKQRWITKLHAAGALATTYEQTGIVRTVGAGQMLVASQYMPPMCLPLQDCRRRRRWHQALERAACSVQGCRAAPISILAALRLGVAQTRSVGTARWVRSLHSRSRRYPRGLRRERRRRCRGSPASRLFAWPYRTCSRHSRKDHVMVDAPPFRRRDPIVRRAARRHCAVSLFRL
jgi:hypothetical protein